MNLFEKATQLKFRYASERGELTTEQLWDLPLLGQPSVKFDLDTVAKTISAELKAATDESFVESKPNKAAEYLAQKLEVVKHIIACKIAFNEELRKKAAIKAERKLLIEALSEKESEGIKALSKEDLIKRIEALGE